VDFIKIVVQCFEIGRGGIDLRRLVQQAARAPRIAEHAAAHFVQQGDHILCGVPGANHRGQPRLLDVGIQPIGQRADGLLEGT